MEIQDKLTRAALRDVAGPVYFSRGEEYFGMGAVRSLREADGAIHATVIGTRPYETSLWIEGEAIKGYCSCPLGRDREFCKHLAATGLAYIEREKRGAREGGAGPPISPKEMEAYLSEQPVSDLVRIIMEEADHDENFYALLRLRAAADAARPNIPEMKRVLQQTMSIRDFVFWKDTHDCTHRIEQVLHRLRAMLGAENAADVAGLVEYAMDLWEANADSVDDSDGSMGMIRDDLHELHLEACRTARPDPVQLAERLALRAINSEWEMFTDSYRTYSDVLGKKGRARYREIVEAEWKKLPRLEPGSKDVERYGQRSTLEPMMLAFAEEAGDLDAVVSVLSRDLSHSHRYLRIAARCREARSFALARGWAEKGLAASAEAPDSRLRTFLADEYVRARRPDDAMGMIWANFAQEPSLNVYQDLNRYARKLKCWESWRKKALQHVRDTINDRKAELERLHSDDSANSRTASRWCSPRRPDHSLLVAILLWEGREEEAWMEAKTGGCSEQHWLDLARRREKQHPEEAIEIYRRQVVPLIEQANNAAYQRAVAFLGRIHGLAQSVGREKQLRGWLMQLKTEYRRKRNFIKYVERKAWGR